MASLAQADKMIAFPRHQHLDMRVQQVTHSAPYTEHQGAFLDAIANGSRIMAAMARINTDFRQTTATTETLISAVLDVPVKLRVSRMDVVSG